MTTPGDQTITVVDVSGNGSPLHRRRSSSTAIPKGYAVDAARGLLLHEPRGQGPHARHRRARPRKIVASWAAGCGADGPRGLALDEARATCCSSPAPTARPRATSAERWRGEGGRAAQDRRRRRQHRLLRQARPPVRRFREGRDADRRAGRQHRRTDRDRRRSRQRQGARCVVVDRGRHRLRRRLGGRAADRGETTAAVALLRATLRGHARAVSMPVGSPADSGGSGTASPAGWAASATRRPAPSRRPAAASAPARSRRSIGAIPGARASACAFCV